MANPTLTPSEYKAIVDANKKVPEKITERIKYVTEKIGRKTGNIGEGIAFILMVFLYFTFTGIAIVLKRKLPKFWEDMGKAIEGGRIVEKIEKVAKEKEIKAKAGKMRVVDLETGQSIL